MDTNEKKESEPAPKNADEGDQSQTTELIERANATAQRLEEANRKQEELIKRQEQLTARSILGGRSEAGLGIEEKKPLTPQELAKKVLDGEINPLTENELK